jgi:hypothetical protein
MDRPVIGREKREGEDASNAQGMEATKFGTLPTPTDRPTITSLAMGAWRFPCWWYRRLFDGEGVAKVGEVAEVAYPGGCFVCDLWIVVFEL